MPILTEKQVLEIAIEGLQIHGLTHDEREGLTTELIEIEALSGATVVWMVSYVSQPGLFEPHDYFMYIEASTGEILYILGPHGKQRTVIS